jgi:hypothetical protein
MSQVMKTNVPVASRSLNAGGFQCLVESFAQGGNRIPSPVRARKERLLGSAAAEVLGYQRPAMHEVLSQVWRNRNHSGLIELGMPDMQQARVEVDIGLGESQKLSGS